MWRWYNMHAYTCDANICICTHRHRLVSRIKTVHSNDKNLQNSSISKATIIVSTVELIYRKFCNRNHPGLNWYLPPPRVLALAATKASSTDWIILMIFSYEYFFDWDNLILMLLFIWTIVYLQTGVTHFTTKNRVSTTHLSYAHSKFRRSDFEVRQKLWSEPE